MYFHLYIGFIEDLQKNFPSTVTTVVSTANKLSTNKDNYSQYQCSLCLWLVILN